MKVLIAEDDRTTRLMLESVVQKWSFEVISVDNGSRAWEVLQQAAEPLVAILDWEIPEVSGLELCRKCIALKKDKVLYNILLTMRDSKEDIVAGLEGGADDYVTKPFDQNELKARLHVATRQVLTQASLNDKMEELRLALEHVKVLQGIIPICMHCHAIRTDSKAWDRLEVYIEEHSDAQFSHAVCPKCMARHYPDVEEGGEF